MKLNDMFKTGTEIALEQVLKDRERRVQFVNNLLSKYDDATVISFKCNIPGPIKNNDVILKLFERGVSSLEVFEFEYKKIINKDSGPEFFGVILDRALNIKNRTVEIEETGIGRLFDIDVFDSKTKASITRAQLHLPYRKCLVCDLDAKECGRNRTHSVQELQNRIIDILIKEK